MHKGLLVPLFLLLMQVNVFGQSAWKLTTEKEGIKIYTREVVDSKIKAIKVECDLTATQSQLVALLMDVNSSAEWVYHTKSCVLIKQVSPAELYYYSEINMPWPVANRDFVAHLTVSQDPETKVVVIDGPVVRGMVPEKKGVVRVDNSTGRWVIKPDGIDQLKVVYTLHTDPGGSIPAWMVNMFATEGPLQVFRKLKVELQKPVYKNAVLPYIEDKQYVLNAAF